MPIDVGSQQFVHVNSPQHVEWIGPGTTGAWGYESYPSYVRSSTNAVYYIPASARNPLSGFDLELSEWRSSAHSRLNSIDSLLEELPDE